MSPMTESILELQGIVKNFGGIKAIDNLTMSLEKGQIVALIGPNGAGKTTVFNVVTGIYTADQGKVLLDGEDITHEKQHVITEKGIARTFQNIRLFSELTVLDNVKIAYDIHAKCSLLESVLRIGRYIKEEKDIEQQSLDLLKIFKLEDKAYEVAKNLPYGAQRRLEIARALATKPRLLLLDEPAAGMNPQETDELSDFIRKIKEDFKLTVFLIEHHMNLVMDISDRIYVLDFGKLISEGTPQQVQDDPAVIGRSRGDRGLFGGG